MKTLLYLCVLCFTGLGFGQDKVDYSDEWATGESDGFQVDTKPSKSLTSKIRSFDLCEFWLSKDQSADGILGETYERIQFFISEGCSLALR